MRDDGVIARLGEQHYYFTTTTSGAANVYRELLLWNARWRMDCAFVNATGPSRGVQSRRPREPRGAAVAHRHRPVRSGVPVPRRARRPASRAWRRACCARDSFPRWVSRFTCRIEAPAGVGRADEGARRRARVRRRSPARVAAREGPRHRRAGHRQPHQSVRSGSGLGGAHGASRSSSDSAACASTCAAARGRSWSASSWRRTQSRAARDRRIESADPRTATSPGASPALRIRRRWAAPSGLRWRRRTCASPDSDS